MPRKKNKRKAIQKATRAAEHKPKSRNIGTIAHVGMGKHGLAMAVLASGIMRSAEPLSEAISTLRAAKDDYTAHGTSPQWTRDEIAKAEAQDATPHTKGRAS